MPNPNFRIEKIADGDFGEVVALVNSAYRGESSRLGWTTEADFLDGQRTDLDTLREEMQNPARHLLVVRKTGFQEIVGTIQLEKFFDEKGPYFHLGLFTIKPNLQNQGLGKWVMSEVESRAREMGVRRLNLGVLHLRSELIAWYERLGFQKTGRTERFPYGEERFGLPKTKGLYFTLFEKII